MEHKTKIIQDGLANAMDYPTYRTLIENHVKNRSSTGANQTEDYINYTKLGDARMRRLDKTLKIDEAIANTFTNYTKKLIWLVLSEGWCGDAGQALPYMFKLASLAPHIDLKIVLRDENLELMNLFLTNGGMSIPKLIVLDAETLQVQGEWGPRPSIATQMVADYKKNHGALTQEFKQELQVWYNKDKGLTTARDLAKLL